MLTRDFCVLTAAFCLRFIDGQLAPLAELPLQFVSKPTAENQVCRTSQRTRY
eukprot:SAG11_NODE_34696_length_270_cov_1.192982_1_plen_51_part_01